MRTGRPKRQDTKWLVRIGEEYAARFTNLRPADAPLRLLGSVARGAQMGALATTADGNGVLADKLGRGMEHIHAWRVRTLTEAGDAGAEVSQ